MPRLFRQFHCQWDDQPCKENAGQANGSSLTWPTLLWLLHTCAGTFRGDTWYVASHRGCCLYISCTVIKPGSFLAKGSNLHSVMSNGFVLILQSNTVHYAKSSLSFFWLISQNLRLYADDVNKWYAPVRPCTSFCYLLIILAIIFRHAIWYDLLHNHM